MKALLVIDVQNDFCEGGSLGVAGGAAVVESISDYIAAHRGEYGAVAATRDRHIDPGAHFSDAPDYVDSWPRHCVVGTPGAEFHPAFDAAAADEVFDKGAYEAAYSGFEGSAADGTGLADWLRARGVSEVDVVGLATDHCVRATAEDAVAAGFATRVLLDRTAGISPESIDAALARLAGAGVELEGKAVNGSNG